MDISLLGFSGISQVYNLHPLFVHFPIALLPTSALFYLIGVIRNSDAAFFAGRATLGLASVGATVAVITGLRAEGSIPHNEIIHRLMHLHESIGITVMILTAGLLVWTSVRREHRPPYAIPFLIVLVLTTGLVLQNGDLGGRMVFIEGAGVRAASSVVVSSHDHQGHRSPSLGQGSIPADPALSESPRPTPNQTPSPHPHPPHSHDPHSHSH